MERRGFLGAILAAGMAPAFVGAKVLMPVKSVIVQAQEYVGLVASPGGGNRLVTCELVAREALKVLNERLSFADSVNREWWYGEQWTAQEQRTIAVRKPQRYVLNRLKV